MPPRSSPTCKGSRRGIEAAETFLRHLPTLPLQIVQNGYEEVLEAARVKARHAIPYADCKESG